MSKVVRRTGKKIELLWDCPYCSTKGIRGGITECPSCGRPRTQSVEFSGAERLNGARATEFVSNEVASRENEPDWMCPYCDSYNKAYETSCKYCGSPRGDNKTYFDINREKEIKRSNEEVIIEKENSVVENIEGNAGENYVVESVREYKAKQKRNSHRFSNVLKYSLLSLLIFLFGFMVFRTVNHKETFTVSDKQWVYTVFVEECNTYQDSGWYPPANARILNKEYKFKETVQKIDHYEIVTREVERSREVPDGYDISYEYEDLGNGYAEEVEVKTEKYRTEYYTEEITEEVPVYVDVDVYDYYYWYEYDRWEVCDKVVTSSHDNSFYWGTPSLSSGERLGNKEEEYYLYNSEGKKYKISGKEDYISVNIGSEVTLKGFGVYKLVK